MTAQTRITPAVPSQADKLDALIAALEAARPEASAGKLFASHAGMRAINAAHDLFEVDALYDLAGDVGMEIGVTMEGEPVQYLVDRHPSLSIGAMRNRFRPPYLPPVASIIPAVAGGGRDGLRAR